MADRGLAPAQELVNALMGRDPPKDPLFNPLAVGSYSLQRDQPNWFGTNVLGTLGKLSEVMPPGAFDAMSVVMPGVRGRLPRVPERPVSAATKYGDRVFQSPVHGMEMDEARTALGQEAFDKLASSAVGGFVTNEGRFVTRAEAEALMQAADPTFRPKYGRGGFDSSETKP